MALEVIDEFQEINCHGKLFTGEGTLQIDKCGTNQTLHIEGLPRLDPWYHMTQFFNLPKIRSAKRALSEEGILTEFGQPQLANR